MSDETHPSGLGDLRPSIDTEAPHSRAHNEDGTFKSDDPATTDINEAFTDQDEDLPPAIVSEDMIYDGKSDDEADFIDAVESDEPDEEDDEPLGDNVDVIVSHVDPVFVNANGRRRSIERDVVVSIPSEMIDVLKNAGISVETQK